MSSEQLPQILQKDIRPWVSNLQENKKGMSEGLVFLTIGLVLMALSLIVPHGLSIEFLIPGLAITFVGVVLSMIFFSSNQTVKKTGIRLRREVSRVPIRQNLDASLKNTSEFLDYPKVVAYSHLLVPRDIIAVTRIITGLLKGRGVSYRTVEVRLDEAIDPFLIPSSRELLKFVLPEDIDIGIGRTEVGGKANRKVTLYVSIFPVTPKNELVVEDWRKRIDNKLKGFVPA